MVPSIAWTRLASPSTPSLRTSGGRRIHPQHTAARTREAWNNVTRLASIYVLLLLFGGLQAGVEVIEQVVVLVDALVRQGLGRRVLHVLGLDDPENSEKQQNTC